MQDKLYKILKVKIDSINRNIDNLNYLNVELEKNNNDLNYIEEKIELFGTSNVLAFDSLTRDEFEKILLMLDPSVSEIFQDKTCNYQGIMYIIQGIKQGISLELTDVQKNAIETFIEQMINKKASLEDTIANLNESKKRLPITDMATLNSELKKYQTIVSKLEENLYIVEIDDIIASLEFAATPIEEKVSVFEFILKYNASIYAENQAPTKEIETEPDYSLNEIDVPEFHYEPINIYDDIKTKDEKKVEVKEESKKEDYSFPTFKDFTKDENITEVAPKVELPEVNLEASAPIEVETPSFEVPLEIEPDSNKEEIAEIKPIEIEPKDLKEETEAPTFEVPVAPTPLPITPMVNETPIDKTNELPIPDSTSTTELEDIIGKIDAKLKEMEIDNKDQTTTNIPDEVSNEETEKVKKTLTDFEIDTNLDTLKYLTNDNVTNTLNLLKEEGLLDDFKSNLKVLSNSLKIENTEFKLLINALKENFGKKEYKEIINIMLVTMPILFESENVIDDFLKNINFYKEHKINLINLFDNNRELLIINNKDLESNYNLTKDYKIELSDENIKYLLANKRVLENLDYYIEAKAHEKGGLLGRDEEFDGYEYVKKNPYKLNNITPLALMKLRFATENDQKIYGNKPGILAGEITNPKVDVLKLSSEYKNQFFDKEYTFTSLDEVEKIEKEVKNKKDFDLEISDNIKLLDSKYMKDELRYVIDGLVFSRLKTIRLYNFLVTKKMPVKEAMLMALTYNSVIKRDEYLKLEALITSLLEGGN